MAEKTTKAESSKKSNKNLIIGIVVAIVVIAIIAVAAVFINKNSLNDAFFVSDGSKYVLNYTAEELGMDDEEFAPEKAHYVYYYTDDTITDVKAYYEFSSEEIAKKAYQYFEENEKDEYKEIAIKGKFVIITANESDYESMTASDIKQQIEFMQALDDVEEAGEGEEEEVEEEEDDEEEDEEETE